MLRAAWIVFENEFRLLARDRAALFMLFFAPIVIIAVAGFSLGNCSVRERAVAYTLSLWSTTITVLLRGR
jgi:ABC-type transport system involved in cytochrome c biogenesis permease component